MNKKAKLPLEYIVVLIIVIAIIAWYILFSGDIGAEAADIIRRPLK